MDLTYSDNTQNLELEVVTDIARLRELAEDYARVADLAGVVLPFQLHGWHLAWAECFLTRSTALADSLLIHVVRGAEGCVGIVPLVLTERPGRGPVRMGTLSVLGRDPYLTEIRAPIIAPGYDASVGRLVAESLAEDPRWDWAYWSGLSSELAQALGVSGEMTTQEPTCDFVLDLPGTWDELRSGLKRNIRESLRHCYNSLKRDELSYSLTVARTRDEIEKWLPVFLELHGARAQLDNTVIHPHRFDSPRTEAFIRAVLDHLSEQGSARLLILHVGGEPAAARIAFEVGDSLYLYYSGFEPKWSKYSVMTTLVAEAIKHAIDCKLKTLNLSAGADVSKTRWGPREVRYSESLQQRQRVRSTLAYRAFEAARTRKASGRFERVLASALPKRSWK